MNINIYEVICPVVSSQPIFVAGENMKDVYDAMCQNFYDETVEMASPYMFTPSKIESIKRVGQTLIASDKSIENIKKNLI